MKSLMKRIAYQFEAEFLKLIKMYMVDDSEDLLRKSEPHFQIILNKHPNYLNHPTVLGLSLGGSYTKTILGSMQDGNMNISYLSAIQNPDKPMHFYDFLDKLILQNSVIYEYLAETENTALGIAIPVMINEDDIPYHPTKIKAVEGLFARDPEQMTLDLNAGSNLRRYFELRNIKLPNIYFEADPIVAHLGGVSRIDMKPEYKSLLLVCGTGMAIADYEVSRTISRLPMQDFDEEIFPRDETENYGFEYGFAGVGLYSFMNRAIRIKSRECDSHLDTEILLPFFKDRYDSKTVSELWESTLDSHPYSDKVKAIKANIDSIALRELQEIATEINRRIVGSLANALIAVAIKLDRDRGPQDYQVIYEGGIALNPNRLPLIKEQIQLVLKKDELFTILGVDKPSISMEELPYKLVLYGENVNRTLQDDVDISLIGTVVGAIANDVL